MLYTCYAPIASPQPIRMAPRPTAGKRIALLYRNQLMQVSTADMLYLEGASNYTIIHTRDKRQYMVAKSLKRLEADLSHPSFCRVHKSTVVNLTYLHDVNFGTDPHLQLNNGKAISISRRRLPQTRRCIRQYQRERAD